MKNNPPRFSILFQISGLISLGIFLMGSDVKPGELMVQEAAVYRAEGRRLQEMGRAEEALTVYQKAVAVDPRYADAYNDMGVMFETLGQDVKAEEAYHSALQLDPTLSAVHSNLALLYERLGKVKEAAEHWTARARMGDASDPWTVKAREKLAQYNIPIPETHQELEKKRQAQVRLGLEAGLSHLEAKRWDLAAKEFERVLALDPANAKAAQKLRLARAKEKEAAQKEEEMAHRRAKEIEAAFPRAAQKAVALKQPEEFKTPPPQMKPVPVVEVKKTAPVLPGTFSDAKALAESLAREKAQTRKSSVHEIYQHGVTAMRERNFEAAVAYFKQVLSFDPNHQDAQLALKRAQAARLKTTQAKP